MAQELCQQQRCGLVISQSQEAPSDVVGLLLSSGDCIGVSGLLEVVAVSAFRDKVYQSTQDLRTEYFGEGKEGSAWLVVVNGEGLPGANSPLTEIPALGPEVIKLYSTKDRQLPQK